MIITNIILHNFKRFDNLDLSFNQGLNIVYGLNEKGKSSIMKAFSCAFFCNAKTRSRKDLDDICSWNIEEKPKVQINFLDNNDKYKLVRDFNTRNQYIEKNGLKVADVYQEIQDYIKNLLGINNQGVYESSAYIAQQNIDNIFSARKDLSKSIEQSLSGSSSSVEDVISYVERYIRDQEKGLHSLAKNYGTIMLLEKQKNELENNLKKLNRNYEIYRESTIGYQAAEKQQLDIGKKLDKLETKYNEIRTNIDANKEIRRINEVYKSINSRISRFSMNKEHIDNINRELEDLDLDKNIVQSCDEYENYRIIQKEKMLKLDERISDIKNFTVVSKHIGLKKKLVYIISIIVVITILIVLKYLYAAGGVIFGLAVYLFFLRKSKYLRIEILKSDAAALSKDIKALESKQRIILDRYHCINGIELKSLKSKYTKYSENAKRFQSNNCVLLAGDSYEQLEEQLNTLSREKLDIENSQLTDAVKLAKGTEEDLIILRRKIGLLKSELKVVESEFIDLSSDIKAYITDYEKVMRCREELESVKVELEYEQTRVAILKKTLKYITEANEEVISSSGMKIAAFVKEYLSILTCNEYNDIKILSNLGILVYSKVKKDWVDPGLVLSRGTIDQIFFLVRIAILNIIASGRQTVILLDDPFVNFDVERMKGVRQMIRGLSAKYQIILFTCHKDFIDWGELIKL